MIGCTGGKKGKGEAGVDDIKVHPALRRNNTLQIDALPVCYSVMQLFLLNYQERNRADVYGFPSFGFFYTILSGWLNLYLL